ncbi:uncharacterized protein G2W53_000469 [Senna tora]|uniref:Uncharacterized protein n=1 Tax=Senna tora TaxID=362788 RepID=A0A834XDY5_9FABA|nr:uncharacterized protein G2W53_000469 [Senna tora]
MNRSSISIQATRELQPNHTGKLVVLAGGDG